MTSEELYKFLKIKFLEAGGVSESQAAEMIGISQAAFNKRLRNGNLKFLEVEKIMDQLGYEIEWVKKEK